MTNRKRYNRSVVMYDIYVKYCRTLKHLINKNYLVYRVHPLINIIMNIILNEFVLNCALIKRLNDKIDNKKSSWRTIYYLCLLLVTKKYLNKPQC